MIEKKDYVLLGVLENESDVLDGFFKDTWDVEIDALIHEYVDTVVPNYVDDIWENAEKISGYVDRARGDRQMEGGEDTTRQLQIGYEYYYQMSLLENLKVLVYNEMVDRVNEYLTKIDGDVLNQLELDWIQTDIERSAETFDAFDDFTKIAEEVEGIVENIKEQMEDIE